MARGRKLPDETDDISEGGAGQGTNRAIRRIFRLPLCHKPSKKGKNGSKGHLYAVKSPLHKAKTKKE
jgi:hypothetical protein